MTETLFMIYSAAAAAVTLWLLGGMAVGRLRRRRRRGRDAVLQRKYLHIVMLALFSGGEEVPRFPLLRRAGARTAQERKARHLFAARKQGEHDDMQVFALQHGITAAPASAAQPPDRHPAEQPERHGGGRRGIYHEKRFGHKSRFKSLDTLPRSRCRLSGKAIYWSTPHSSRLRTACSDWSHETT